MRCKWAFFFIVLLCYTMPITTTNPIEPVTGQSVSTLQNGKNFLNVTKTVDPKEVEIYKNVTVNIEIKNPANVTNANTTIFELNVTEDSLPSWSLTIIDTGNLSALPSELGINRTVAIFYVLRPEKSGNFTLPGAKITYEDINGTHYETFTAPVNLNVLPKIGTEDWRNVFLLCITAIGLPGIPWALLYFSKRKTYIFKKKKRT